MIVLITPTGGRPEQIKICASLMMRQTYTGEVLWVVVDDCEPCTTDFITDYVLAPNWHVLKVYPRPAWQVGQNTQGRNLDAGINAMAEYVNLSKVEGIFIIEDDDYYKPVYLTEMCQKLKGYTAVGEQCTIYYNVRLRCWLRNLNYEWSSLFQTAFTPAALPIFRTTYASKFIDCSFFPQVPCKNLFRAGDLSIGIKGMAGRGGIGMGHTGMMSYIPDKDGATLYKLIGYDAKIYIPDININNTMYTDC